MGTEILRPQDCLIERIGANPTSFSRRRSHYQYGSPMPVSVHKAATNNGSNNVRSRKPAATTRRQPAAARRSGRSSSDDLRGFKTESVTILRRGESLRKAASSGGLADMEQRRAPASDIYAGSAFAMSPEPSSLPLPSFSRKAKLVNDDSATRDLRRLLRLE